MIRLSAPHGGSHLREYIEEMLLEANSSQDQVTGNFNGINLTASPGDIPESIETQFRTETKKRSEAYMASPEGQAQAALDVQAQLIAIAAEREGILPFSVRDQAEWEEFVQMNLDPYSSATVRYAARWASLMEQRLAKGADLDQIAEVTSYEANLESISGFMFGCALAALIKFWINGEKLRIWHDKSKSN